ncbi:hypothetical protein ABIE29_003666 [Serratia sp. 2723]
MGIIMFCSVLFSESTEQNSDALTLTLSHRERGSIENV